MDGLRDKLKSPLKPLKAESLTEQFVKRFERIILAGEAPVGMKLPSERDLALQLGVGRQVVHEGLLDLASKGLVTMRPRAGAVVNDFRRDGSLALTKSFTSFYEGRIDRSLVRDLMEFRILVETETARLAALHRTDEHVSAMIDLLRREAGVDKTDVAKVADLNFQFHHQVALACGNILYPLLVNGAKHLIKNPIGRFYKSPDLVAKVFTFHIEAVGAIKAKDPEKASSAMRKILAEDFPGPIRDEKKD